MSNGEKDRFGDKLHDLEKGREDVFFAERERALIAKLRAQRSETSGSGSCPTCGVALTSNGEGAGGIPLRYCAEGHGVWLDPGELAAVAEKAGLDELAGAARRLVRPR